MKPYRRLAVLLTLAAFAPLGGIAAATDNAPPPPARHHGPMAEGRRINPERRLARLTEKLGLSADQQAKLRPILAAQAKALKAIDETPLTGEQRREMMRELHLKHRGEIGAILTPAQRESLRKMHPKHRRMGPGAPEGLSAPAPEDAE